MVFKRQLLDSCPFPPFSSRNRPDSNYASCQRRLPSLGRGVERRRPSSHPPISGSLPLSSSFADWDKLVNSPVHGPVPIRSNRSATAYADERLRYPFSLHGKADAYGRIGAGGTSRGMDAQTQYGKCAGVLHVLRPQPISLFSSRLLQILFKARFTPGGMIPTHIAAGARSRSCVSDPQRIPFIHTPREMGGRRDRQLGPRIRSGPAHCCGLPKDRMVEPRSSLLGTNTTTAGLSDPAETSRLVALA